MRERVVSVLSQLLPREPPTDPIVDADTRQLDDAIQMAFRLLSLDPLQEDIHRLLMRLFLQQGRRGAALEQYRFCRLVLKQELGEAPTAETEVVYRAIREGHPDCSVREGTGTQPPTNALLESVTSRPAVAVLPFTNLNQDSAKLYFSDGMSEDITMTLSGWRRFPLIATSSTLTYRDRGDSYRRVADELGARYLVTGSVRHTDRRTRIHVRLIDAESGHILWTERFDLTLDEFLAAQEECAERISAEVEPQLEDAALSQIVAKRTEDLTAWDRFLQGIWLLNRFTRESCTEARLRFRQAIELDRSYSDAFTGLAESYLYGILLLSGEVGVDGEEIRRSDPLMRAHDAAKEAVTLDPGSSAAHLALGHANVWAQRFDSAIAETELSIELNPSNANARRALGNRLDLIGRTAEGIAQMERAFQLNPRDPRKWLQIGYLTRAHLDAGHYDEALWWAQKAVGQRCDQPDPHFRLSVCLAHLGRKAEARAALKECERLHPGFVASKSTWQPYSDPHRNEHFFAGLRRLSLI